MSNIENPTTVRFVVKGEYYESDVTSSFDPKVHLQNVMSKKCQVPLLMPT